MNEKSINYRDGKKEFQRFSQKGNSYGVCATFNKKYLCCNVHVLNSIQNCPFECSYCFLQNYLTDGTTKSVSDIRNMMDAVKRNIAEQPHRLFRIGTWELGDSLALEHKTGQAEKLIYEFGELENAVLELKTKSDNVESILDIDHKGKTVVSWSLNTKHVIDSEEHQTASLDMRLKSINKVARAGYLIGLHFDPMILHDNWEDGYDSLVKDVFNGMQSDRIAWISIGSLRFNPEMKKKIENNYPDNRLTNAEMVLGDDGKMRYVKPLRAKMYSHIYKTLKENIPDKFLVYLCMERWDMWDRVFGWRPDSSSHLDFLFAKSLYEKYGLGPVKPERRAYESWIRKQEK